MTGATDATDVCKPRRIFHLWLPFLPTDRLARAGAAHADSRVQHGGETSAGPPRATVERSGGALVVAAVDDRARRSGLFPGQSLAEARAQVPTLKVDAADPQADAAMLSAIARAADRYTPLVGLDPPCGLFLDITGCSHLFGGEEAMILDVLARVARAGFSARAAVADNPAIAWAVARHGQGGVVPSGEGLAAVAPLPVAALRLPGETVAVLARLGLKSVGQLLSQPRAPLVKRFGPLLARRIDQLEGRESEPITPLSPVAAFTVERRFAEPLMHMDGVEAAARALSERLSGALEARGEGARRITLRLFHADGAVRQTGVGTSAPLSDPARIAALLRPRLEALAGRFHSDSGIDLIRLCADETAPLVPRQETFDGAEALQAGLARLVDTLSERLGPACVQRLVPVDTHQPARAEARRPAREALIAPPWPATPPCAPSGEGDPPRRPIRLFAPPEPVETMASVPDGPPVRFVWRRVTHHVAAAEGPERIAPEWWDAPPDGLFTCDHFRVEDTEGRRFWMVRRGLYGRETDRPQWFIQGLFA